MKQVAVIGGGMIGASLSCLFAGNGINVVLVEKEGFTDKALENCNSVFNGLIAHDLANEKQTAAALARIDITTDYAKIADMEFIFECVFERTPIKHAVYEEIEKVCVGKNVKAIASSSSAISADELAEGFKDADLRSKFVVAHPWNPPHLTPCVELVKSQYVSQDAVDFTKTFLESVGKKPIVLEKNIPGFIGNRLQYAMLREAYKIVELGAATPEAVDECLKYSFAPRYTSIGIFDHFDNCGQDLTYDISLYLNPELADNHEPSPALKKNFEEGNFGIKSGKGMKDWTNVDIAAFRERAAAPYYKFCNWSWPV